MRPTEQSGPDHLERANELFTAARTDPAWGQVRDGFRVLFGPPVAAALAPLEGIIDGLHEACVEYQRAVVDLVEEKNAIASMFDDFREFAEADRQTTKAVADRRRAELVDALAELLLQGPQ